MPRLGWDERKNKANRKKHGIWFEEARTVFDDPRALLFSDPDHSDEEDRFILLGASSEGGRLLSSIATRNPKNYFVLFRQERRARKR
jgi:uncharacterized DUF497 family protein